MHPKAQRLSFGFWLFLLLNRPALGMFGFTILVLFLDQKPKSWQNPLKVEWDTYRIHDHIAIYFLHFRFTPHFMQFCKRKCRWTLNVYLIWFINSVINFLTKNRFMLLKLACCSSNKNVSAFISNLTNGNNSHTENVLWQLLIKHT